MKATLTILLLTIICYSTSENCHRLGVNFYESLGCKHETTDGGCPSSFDCSSLSGPSDKCLLKGKTYNVGEEADEGLQGASCNVGCTCRHSIDGGSKAKFLCAILDCPEFLGVPIPNGCYRKYKLGECCSTGHQCPPFEDVATCEYNGKTYREGEKFYPDDTCQTCVCQKGFTGKLEAPFCQEIMCGTQLRSSEDLDNNCAPVYGKMEKSLCCPRYMACPTKDDVFTEATGTNTKTCKFGDREIKTGQVMKRTTDRYGRKEEIECECKIPPFLTCIATE